MATVTGIEIDGCVYDFKRYRGDCPCNECAFNSDFGCPKIDNQDVGLCDIVGDNYRFVKREPKGETDGND